MLSDSESEDGSIHRLVINEHYAKAFEYRKEREELAKLKEKYGSDAEEDDDMSETDSEEAESEDEHGEELTPAVDAAILRTLAKIKRKDPDIYNVGKGIFEEEQKKIAPLNARSSLPHDKSKPITIRQVALQSALNANSRSPSPAPAPHAEEQRALRDETIQAFHKAVDGEPDDEDRLFVLREKTKDEIEKAEEEYREFLEREVGGDLGTLITVDEDPTGVRERAEEDEQRRKKKRGKDKGKDKDEVKAEGKGKDRKDADQEFLMNYILSRGWIDRSARRVPTYKEITGSRNAETMDGTEQQLDMNGENIGHGGLADEDEFDDMVDVFETSYNFRFEEPDGTMIKSYPRTIPSLIRREDTSRKEARERRKARKEEELLKKREEVRRLKRLKMKDIRAKLERIGRDGGKNLEDNKALQQLDLDADWDADAHDKQMAAIYDDEDEPDAEKPQWDDDIDIGDIIGQQDLEPANETKKKKKKRKKDKEKEAVDGVDVDEMDADRTPAPSDDDEEWDGTEEARKRKLEEYMDEIYALEFNDMVAGMPTRFKYASVPAQSFALAPADILLATDAELNQYISVKKYAPYKAERRWDQKRGERLRELKEAIAERGTVWDEGAERPIKKRKGKKERMKAKEVSVEEAVNGSGGVEGLEDAEPVSNSQERGERETTDDGNAQADSRKRKRKRHKNV